MFDEYSSVAAIGVYFTASATEFLRTLSPVGIVAHIWSGLGFK